MMARSDIKLFAKILLSSILYYSGVFLILRQWHNLTGRKLTILTFHRVTNGDDDNQSEHSQGLPTICIDQKNFDLLVRYIAKRYRVISVADYLRYGEELPNSSLVITFDDGYKETISNALQVLSKYGVKAHLFVPTALIDKNGHFWWDEIYSALMNVNGGRLFETDSKHALGGDVLERLNQITSKSANERKFAIFELIEFLKNSTAESRENIIEHILGRLSDLKDLQSTNCELLNWDDIRTLSDSQFDIGSHTVNHQFLASVSEEEAIKELQHSRTTLEEKLNRSITSFSYPGGSFNDKTEELIRTAGYATAFTTNEGINALNGDPYKLKRINISDDEVQGYKGRFSKALVAWTLYFRYSRETS